jgi:hypothetical protein
VDEAEYRDKLNALEEQLTAVYRERRKLTEAYAETHPAVLPPARFRTDAQARVARCPRCSMLLGSDISGAKNEGGPRVSSADPPSAV